MKLHHIGIASPDLTRTVEQFQKLGGRLLKDMVDLSRDVKLALIATDNVLLRLFLLCRGILPYTIFLNVGLNPIICALKSTTFLQQFNN